LIVLDDFGYNDLGANGNPGKFGVTSDETHVIPLASCLAVAMAWATGKARRTAGD
jgi:hypothetical protein